MSQHESPDTLNGIEEPSTEELMFLERFSADPSRIDSVLAEEVETSEDVYAQGEAMLVRGNLDDILSSPPEAEEEDEEKPEVPAFD